MSDSPRWFYETEVGGARLALRVDRVLVEDVTDHQHLMLFENARFGRVLTLDGMVQLTEADEFLYHEMLAHAPLAAHPDPKRVLIVGGGDGGLLREVLKDPRVEHAVLAEIDSSVIAFSQEHLPFVSQNAFDDPRTEIVIADAAAWVSETDQTFDVILVDSTDPDGPGEVLFTDAFYAACKTRLTQDGILAVQAGVPFLQPEVIGMVTARLGAQFDRAGVYLTTVPSYSGGVLALGFASDARAAFKPSPSQLDAHAARVGALNAWSPDTHQAAFTLPGWIQALAR